MDIIFKNNIAEFEMDFTYYDLPAVFEASKEFTELCWISIFGSDDGKKLSIRIEPKEKDNDVKEAVYSFFNYMLGLMTGRLKDAQTNINI